MLTPSTSRLAKNADTADKVSAVGHAQRRETAIVVGAGFSGLLAARVLSTYFDSVAIYERDARPGPGGLRPGTPQSYHAHHLLFEGKRIIDMLLPGFAERFESLGGKCVDFGQDFRFFQCGSWREPTRLGAPMYLGLRQMLEQAMLQEIEALENVSIHWDAHVSEIVTEKNKATGIRFAAGERSEGREAALVVDASGRWCSELLRETKRDPAKEAPIDVWYTTFLLNVEATSNDWTVLIGYNQRPQQRVACYAGFTPKGYSTLQLTVMSYGVRPPKEEQKMVAFLEKEAPAPIFAALLKTYRSIEPARQLAFPTMVWRPTPPTERLLVVGDAACSVDPVTGVGITRAAIEADLLQSCLSRERDLASAIHSFQRQSAKVRRRAWVFLDEQNARFRSPRSARRLVLGWYIDRVMEAAQADNVMFRKFIDVRNLIRPMSCLWSLPSAARVLAFHLRRWWSRRGTAVVTQPRLPNRTVDENSAAAA